MRKRILSTILALCMCMALFATAALAEGGDDNVAEVFLPGTTFSTEYDTFEKAFNNAHSTGSTIKLLKDTGFATGTTWQNAQINKSLTLDLNGHDFKWFDNDSSEYPATTIVATGNTVTITDSADNKGTFYRLRVEGTVTLTDGVKVNYLDVNGGTLAVEDAEITDELSVGNTSTVNIKGGKVAYLNNDSISTLATVKLSGGEFGGIYKGTNAASLAEMLASGYAYQYTDDGTNPGEKVERSTLDSVRSIQNVKVVECTTHSYDSTTGQCKYCNHKCTTHDWIDLNGVCKTCGYECKHDGATGTDPDKCSICGMELKTYVAQIGENKYETFKEALENAKAGNTIKLLQDVEQEVTSADSCNEIKKNIALDLNGCSFSYTGYHSMDVTAEVTITDTGTSSTKGQLKSDLYVGYGGEVTLKGGVKVTSATANGGTLKVEDAAISYLNLGTDDVLNGGGTLIMSGGSVTSLTVYPSSTVTLSGGSLTDILRYWKNGAPIPGAPEEFEHDYTGTPTFNKMLKSGYAYQYTTNGNMVELANIDDVDNDTTLQNVKVVQCTSTSHSYDSTTGQCKYCNHKCTTHDWSNHDGACANCGYECDHTGSTGTDPDKCSVCGMELKTYVAQIGTTKYKTFNEAYEKANSGDTITLLANAKHQFTDGVREIKWDKSLTIDLGGYTLTADGDLKLDKGEYTFQNGTVASSITANGSSGAVALTLGKDFKHTGNILDIENDVTLKITSNTVEVKKLGVYGSTATCALTKGTFGEVEVEGESWSKYKTVSSLLADGFAFKTTDGTGIWYDKYSNSGATSITKVMVHKQWITDVTLTAAPTSCTFGETVQLTANVARAEDDTAGIYYEWYQDDDTTYFAKTINDSNHPSENPNLCDYSPSSAGTHTIYVKVTTHNYTRTSEPITVMVNEATPAYTAPTANTPTYNGEDQALVQAGTVSHGTMQYRLGENGTWSDAVPKAADAGTYTVYWQIVGDTNYEDVTGTAVTVTIARKTVTPTVMVANGSGIIYNGNEQKPTVMVMDGNETISESEYSVTYGNNINAGTGTVTVTCKEGGNYAWAKPVTQNFTIQKADPTHPTDLVGYVGNKLSSVKLPEGWTWGDNTQTLSSNEGNQTFYANYAGNDNYNTASNVAVTVSVRAKSQQTLTVSMDGWTYGETANSPSYTTHDGAGDATVEYKVKGADDNTYTATVPTNAGDYTVRVTYETGTEIWTGTKDFTIEKKDIKDAVITLDKDTFTYNGSDQKPTVTSVKDGDTPLTNDTDYTVFCTAQTNAGEGYTLTITGKGNYTGTAEKKWNISKAELSVSVTASDKEYDGNTNATISSVSFTGLVNGETLTRDTDYTVKAAFVSADANYLGALVTYTVTLIDSDKTKNYSLSSGTGTTTANIEEKPIAVTITAEDKVYDGTTTAKVTAKVDPADLIAGDSITITGWIGEFEDANVGDNKTVTVKLDGTMHITGNGSGNYSLITQTTGITASIKPAAASVTNAPTANTLTYNGTAQDLVTAGTASGGTMQYSLNGTSWIDTIPTGINATDYTVWYRAVGDSNHSDSDAASIPVTIGKAALTGVSVSQTGTLTYNGSAQTATVSAEATTVDGSEVSFTYSATEDGTYSAVVPAFTTGTNTVYYKADAANHATASGSFEVTIGRAALTGVSVSQTGTLTYNGAPQTATVATTATTVDGSEVSFTYSATEDGTYSAVVPAFTTGTNTVYYKADAANHATASGSFEVTIGKATVTIKALDKSAYTGTAAPDLSKPAADKDYTITGLIGTDTLDVTIVLTCDANMNKVGKYDIVPSVTGEDSRYGFVFENGKLTVSDWPVIPSTGSTVTNPDGSTTTTTVNSQTGTVTETTRNPDGTTGTTVTDKNGTVTGVSANVPANAAKDGQTVPLPVGAVQPGSGTTINVTVPAGGATVEIPVKNPTPGMVIVIVDKNGNETVVPTTKQTENGVTVTLTGSATIRVIDNSQTFSDVKERDYFAAAVQWASARGITGGTSATTFGPHESCTRAQLVTFLWRAAGCPEPNATSSFSDVSAEAYYAKAVAWAFENGIVGGYGNGQFGSEDTITREQMAVILFRFAQHTGMDTTQSGTTAQAFSDYDSVSNYAVAAVQWAVNAGIMQGADGRLMPQEPCTRAQIVTMLYRLLGE